MKKQRVLLNVSYTDNTDKFWQDSYVKNKIVTLVNNNIHETVKSAVLENDGMELLYKGKPRTNVFIDDKEGNAIPVGYIYRGKTEVRNDKKGKWEKALFDVWVDIKAITDYPITVLD
jgi:hypothetical protein